MVFSQFQQPWYPKCHILASDYGILLCNFLRVLIISTFHYKLVMNSARMQFVILGLAITLGILVLIQSTNYVTAQGEGNVTGARFLMIQEAQSGSVSELNATTSTLELNDVSDKTVLFSDRPDRIVASVNTTDFIGNWSIGENNFAVDPPNAALVVDDDVEQRQDLAVIELYNPEYDPGAKTLNYDMVTENRTSIDLPSEFEQSTLVIDDDPGDDGLLDKPDSNQ